MTLELKTNIINNINNSPLPFLKDTKCENVLEGFNDIKLSLGLDKDEIIYVKFSGETPYNLDTDNLETLVSKMYEDEDKYNNENFIELLNNFRTISNRLHTPLYFQATQSWETEEDIKKEVCTLLQSPDLYFNNVMPDIGLGFEV